MLGVNSLLHCRLIHRFTALIALLAIGTHVMIVHAHQESQNNVDYQRDIAPLLAEHCSHCHGVDEASRQGGLRLDKREDALRGGDSGARAIALDDVDNSEILKRVLSNDPDIVMPHPAKRSPLAQREFQNCEIGFEAVLPMTPIGHSPLQPKRICLDYPRRNQSIPLFIINCVLRTGRRPREQPRRS